MGAHQSSTLMGSPCVVIAAAKFLHFQGFGIALWLSTYEQARGRMSDQVSDVTDVEQLIGEINALRGKVAQLQERVEQLDMLAHEDSLVELPNRRGFMRALARLIDRVRR